MLKCENVKERKRQKSSRGARLTSVTHPLPPLSFPLLMMMKETELKSEKM